MSPCVNILFRFEVCEYSNLRSIAQKGSKTIFKNHLNQKFELTVESLYMMECRQRCSFSDSDLKKLRTGLDQLHSDLVLGQRNYNFQVSSPVRSKPKIFGLGWKPGIHNNLVCISSIYCPNEAKTKNNLRPLSINLNLQS